YSRTHTRTIAQLGGLLKVTPFISTEVVIAGLCSLGLPGLSGFVAEMTIFMGVWHNPDNWYRLATTPACASIVVTAVYILRATGKTVFGPMSSAYEHLKDASWNEKMAAGILMLGILIMGMAPFLIQDLINPGTENIMRQFGKLLSIK